MSGKRLPQIKMETELKLLATREAEAAALIALLWLEDDPAMAKRIGCALRLAAEEFERAYPGETRTRLIPNAVLRKNGRPAIARMNELMGLDGL